MYQLSMPHKKCQIIFINQNIKFSQRVLFQFFPDLRQLITITKSVESINLKTN